MEQSTNFLCTEYLWDAWPAEQRDINSDSHLDSDSIALPTPLQGQSRVTRKMFAPGLFSEG